MHKVFRRFQQILLRDVQTSSTIFATASSPCLLLLDDESSESKSIPSSEYYVLTCGFLSRYTSMPTELMRVFF